MHLKMRFAGLESLLFNEHENDIQLPKKVDPHTTEVILSAIAVPSESTFRTEETAQVKSTTNEELVKNHL
jgi:hypothetical protein